MQETLQALQWHLDPAVVGRLHVDLPSTNTCFQGPTQFFFCVASFAPFPCPPLLFTARVDFRAPNSVLWSGGCAPVRNGATHTTTPMYS